MDHKPVLAEQWLPIEMIGAECMRERGASSALPPLYFLHVWWARRPLTISRAAILGSLLPIWSADWPEPLRQKFPTEESYRKWFLELIGIYGDPVEGRKKIAWAKERDIKLAEGPYTYKRAFTKNPEQAQVSAMRELLGYRWGSAELAVCDPMAGGGSIPFESLRFGFKTLANELNSVASVILKATLDYPRRFGVDLGTDIRLWGRKLSERVEQKLGKYFPKAAGDSIHAYIWARTVTCPVSGKPVPLSPNWWLRKGDNPVAVKLVARAEEDACRFQIVTGKAAIAAKPDVGTVKKGVGKSPWTGDAIDGDYIKREAQAGRMGQQLYAVAVKSAGGFTFRAPTDEDLAAVKAAEKELARRLPEWEAKGLVPTELRYEGPADRSINYGIVRWADCFSPRQLLSLLTFLEEMLALRPEMEAECGKEKAEAIQAYLGIAFDKAIDRNSLLCSWLPQRQVIAHTFVRHDFSFRWSFAEFDASANLLPWSLDQAVESFQEIAKLAASPAALFTGNNSANTLSLTKGNAASLPHIADGSIHSLCVDPPYYDNVMYAECSDFFYVWQKRTVGDLFPGWFDDELTNKDDEAVANSARFEGSKKKKDQAALDYERKMAACFREMHRVLHPDGVLTVMFTHKKVEAWNTLATSLIGAGFSIQTSWPVHTEFEHSLHQAKKNAAASTILLVCRKRGPEKEPFWWDDIKGRVRDEAREKARLFHSQGISGVDLYISTFGPVLSILSQNWPVLSAEVDDDGKPKVLKPDVALDLARREVIELRKQELLHGRMVKFDEVTDWYLMAWDAFRAEEFPGDEARKLAIVLGLGLEDDLVSRRRVISKKGSNVVLQQPLARRKKGMVDPEAEDFDCWVDAVHTALLVHEEDGSKACEAFLKRVGLRNDSTLKAVIQAMINAIPRVRPEAKVLDALRLKFYEDLTPAPEEKIAVPESQIELFADEEKGEDDEDAEEEE